MWAGPLSVSPVIIFIWLSTKGHILQNPKLTLNMQIFILVNNLWALAVSFCRSTRHGRVPAFSDDLSSQCTLLECPNPAKAWSQVHDPVYRGLGFPPLSLLFLPYFGTEGIIIPLCLIIFRLSNPFSPNTRKPHTLQLFDYLPYTSLSVTEKAFREVLTFAFPLFSLRPV